VASSKAGSGHVLTGRKKIDGTSSSMSLCRTLNGQTLRKWSEPEVPNGDKAKARTSKIPSRKLEKTLLLEVRTTKERKNEKTPSLLHKGEPTKKKR